MNTRALRDLSLCWAAVMAAGCGGGAGNSPIPSSSEPVPQATATARGSYVGGLVGGASKHSLALVLENDEFWALYGTYAQQGWQIAGFVQGSGRSTAGRFSVADARDFGPVPSAPATVTGEYTASWRTLSSTLGSGSDASRLVVWGGEGLGYSRFREPLVNFSGAWAVRTPRGETASFTLAEDGSFSGYVGECAFSGSLAPRPAGNVYGLSLQFGPERCALAGVRLEGIALLDGGFFTQQALLMAVDGTRSVGFAAAGARDSLVSRHGSN